MSAIRTILVSKLLNSLSFQVPSKSKIIRFIVFKPQANGPEGSAPKRSQRVRNRSSSGSAPNCLTEQVRMCDLPHTMGDFWTILPASSPPSKSRHRRAGASSFTVARVGNGNISAGSASILACVPSRRYREAPDAGDIVNVGGVNGHVRRSGRAARSPSIPRLVLRIKHMIHDRPSRHRGPLRPQPDRLNHLIGSEH